MFNYDVYVWERLWSKMRARNRSARGWEVEKRENKQTSKQNESACEPHEGRSLSSFSLHQSISLASVLYSLLDIITIFFNLSEKDNGYILN